MPIHKKLIENKTLEAINPGNSDRPVLLGTSKLDAKVGFGKAEALLYFPLSQELCLIGRNVGKEHRFAQPYNNVSDPRLASLPRILMWAKSVKLIIASDISALPSIWD